MDVRGQLHDARLAGLMERNIVTELIAFLEGAVFAVQSSLDQVWSWLSRTFFVPGDYILAFLLARTPELAGNLGLGEDAYGGLYAGLLSAGTWLAALLLARAGYNAIRDLLRSLASLVRRSTLAASHRLRMFRRRFGFPITRIRNSLRARRSGFEEFEIDDLQMAILHEQVKLAPGHVITAVDIAHDLGVRPLRAQQALDTLKRLHLVEVSFGTTDGYAGYQLTRPGQVFLSTISQPF